MHRKTRIMILLVACLLVPTVGAMHSADTHITSRRVYTEDGDYTGHVHADAYLQTNESVRFGDNGSALLGNLTNETLTDYREWTLPDASGRIGVSSSDLEEGGVVFAGAGGLLATDEQRLRWDPSTESLLLDSDTLAGGGFLIYADSDEAPAVFTRNVTDFPSGLLFENYDTTNGNGLGLNFFSTTTGAGAADHLQFGGLSFRAMEHDHASRSGRFTVSVADAADAAERFRVDAGGGFYTRADTNAGFYRNAASALTTNATLTIAATKSLVLTPTSTATLPAAARGAVVYDVTTDQLKVGVGSSPAYQVAGFLGVAQSWGAAQTFTSTLAATAAVSFTAQAAGGVEIKGSSDTPTSDYNLQFRRSRGTTASPTDVVNGDEISEVGFNAYSGGAFRQSAVIHVTVQGTVTSGQTPPSGMDFYTTTTGGTQTLALSLSPAQKVRALAELEVEGALNHDGSTAGFFTATPVTQRTRAAQITDSTGGSVSATCAAMTFPADSPITADALRDDLVTNYLTQARNCVASLLDRVNKLDLALSQAGGGVGITA